MQDIQFVPSFSIKPNQVTSYNTIFKKSTYTNEWNHISHYRTNSNLKNSETDKLNKDKLISHNMKISDSANRNLRNKINWLYYNSVARKVRTPKGKEIFNFKIAFITLTLPAQQKQPTKEITADLLNHFLTTVRGRFNMQNYVWRLEFQKNKNVHYHIVTDTYIDFYILKSIWNNILAKKGYITDYQNKMKGISLTDYYKQYYQSKPELFNKCKENYTKQTQESWTNPPTINVKSVVSNKKIGGYIAKYFSKDSKSNTIKNDLDNAENTQNLRLWFCSRALSKLNKISDFCEAVNYDIFAIASYCSDLKIVQHKYTKIFYFELAKTFGTAKDWFDKILSDYSTRQGYIPATF